MKAIAKVLAIGALAGLAACSVTSEDPASGEEDLTSLTARQRKLSFDGMIYVEPETADDDILDAVQTQTQSAFGALMHQEVMVQSRELRNVDPRSLRKRSVRVVDLDGAEREMTEVRYRYEDNAVVPIAMARKTALAIGLLGQGAGGWMDEIISMCTTNDAEAREDARGGLLWYHYDPSKPGCRRAIEQEQRAIDEDAAALADPRRMVPQSRAERVFVPITVSLARADSAEKATYPEYDQLFAGGAEPGVLTIVMLVGRLAHAHVEPRKDAGYFEWMDALGVVFAENPDFVLTKVEPAASITKPKAAGKTWDVTFSNIVDWTVYGRGWPEGLPASARDELADNVASMLDERWVTFEKKVKVSIGDREAKDLTIRIETFFGAEESPAPHRRALTRGDVVLYNGHSYIGYGPLDPDNFVETRFPGSYQMFFFDSCVSYNYYEKDFFGMKEGGSKNLDMITNGLEAPEYMSGAAEGALVAKLIGGTMPSYQALLEAAKATDSLRVVDGEIDNRYHPSRMSVRLVRP